MEKGVFDVAVATCAKEIWHYRRVAQRLRELELKVGNLPSLVDVRLVFALPSYHEDATINFVLRNGREGSSLPHEMAAALGTGFEVQHWSGDTLAAVFQLDGYRVRIVNWQPSNMKISFEEGKQ
jgi:hypothetical protein